MSKQTSPKARMLDDAAYRYRFPSPGCAGCRRRVGHQVPGCSAFPERIPLEIWNAPTPAHREPIAGDQGSPFKLISLEDRVREVAYRAAGRARLIQLTDAMRQRRGLPPINRATFSRGRWSSADVVDCPRPSGHV